MGGDVWQSEYKKGTLVLAAILRKAEGTPKDQSFVGSTLLFLTAKYHVRCPENFGYPVCQVALYDPRKEGDQNFWFDANAA